MSIDAELRAAVAARHGLPEGAGGFLVGANLAELEESAEQFARLVGDHRRPEEEPAPAVAPPNIFAEALAEKQRRKAELHRMLSGRQAEQPRDAKGRFTSGFDGGARPAIPVPTDPAREHDELVAGMANFARTFGL